MVTSAINSIGIFVIIQVLFCIFRGSMSFFQKSDLTFDYTNEDVLSYEEFCQNDGIKFDKT